MRHIPLIILSLLIATANATLTATFSSGGKSVTKQVRMPALRVEEGEPPAAGLAPGAFTVDLKGTVTIPKRYRVYFSYDIEGTATLKVNGEEVPFEGGKSERLRLNQGQATIEVQYKSLDNGSVPSVSFGKNAKSSFASRWLPLSLLPLNQKSTPPMSSPITTVRSATTPATLVLSPCPS